MSVIRSSRKVEVEHVVLESPKPFAEVREKLEAAIPPLEEEGASILRLGVDDALRRPPRSATSARHFPEATSWALVRLHGEARQALQ